MNRRIILAAGLMLAFEPSLLLAKDVPRNPDWAIPVSLKGVPNLNKVSPFIYRSAQPTSDGFKSLQEKLGVKTVLSLREYHDDTSLIAGTGLKLQSVPMNALNIRTTDVVSALKTLVAARQDQPILVHCRHGADRTGVVIAMYRVVVQGWTKDKAINELENGGFGFHSFLFNIPNFVRQADIVAYRRALAISP